MVDVDLGLCELLAGVQHVIRGETQRGSQHEQQGQQIPSDDLLQPAKLDAVESSNTYDFTHEKTFKEAVQRRSPRLNTIGRYGEVGCTVSAPYGLALSYARRPNGPTE